MNGIHLLDRRDGSQYPYELLQSIPVNVNGWQVVIPGRDGLSQRGLETDLGSIPRIFGLKKLLEPLNFVPCAVYAERAVLTLWIYHETPSGPCIVGYIEDPRALAYILHDWMYAVRVTTREFADTELKNRIAAHSPLEALVVHRAVRMFGGWPWRDCNPKEVAEDRELSRLAFIRVFKQEPTDRYEKLA